MADMFNIDALRHSLNYHSERHNVIASNIANANTPGFRPNELLRDGTQGIGSTLPLERTQSVHLSATGLESELRASVVADNSVPAGLDGNSVSIEREMSKLQANDLRYEGAAKLISRQFAMLKYAANDGSGG